MSERLPVLYCIPQELVKRKKEREAMSNQWRSFGCHIWIGRLMTFEERMHQRNARGIRGAVE
jgi:hypothetical protein